MSSISAVGFDEIEELSEGLPLSSTPPPGLSPLSSLEACEENTPPLSTRPKLAPPKENYLLGVIRNHQRLERVTNAQAKLYEMQANEDLDELKNLDTEKGEVLRKKAEATKLRNTWNILKTVAGYLTAASSIVLGIAALPVATGAGVLLICSGVASLINQFVRDTVGWETITGWFTRSEEAQKRWAHRIEMGLFFVSMGLGLAGGIWAFRAGAFTAAGQTTGDTIRTRLTQIIAIASSAIGMGARLGESFEDKKIKHFQARMTEINYRMHSIQQDLYTDTTQTRNMIDTVGSIGDSVKEAISLSAVSFD